MLTNGQTKRRNYTNFESNLAMIVIYLPVKFEFEWKKHFQVQNPETERLMDKLTQNGQKNGWNYINFESTLAIMVTYHPVKIEFDWTKHFRVIIRKQKC